MLLPYHLHKIVGKDANFELVQSSILQPIRLFYNENVITRSKVVIFVNEKIDLLETLLETTTREEQIEVLW